MAGLVLIGTLFLFILIGFPIAVSIGLSCVLYVLAFHTVPMDFIIQSFLNGTYSFTLLAIPFFVLSGELMINGGISQRLINFCMSLIKNRKGGLGMVTVIACMFFAAISGSGPATVACIGGIMIPQMIRYGYDKEFSTSITAAAGSLGPIIPPSIMFLLYGVVYQVSVSKLFMGGVVPGVLMGIALLFMTKLICGKKNFTPPPEVAEESEKLFNVKISRSFRESFWALLVPVIILGGIYGGIFSPTEAAVVACMYALFVGFFIYKELRIKDLPMIFIRAFRSCSFLIVISFSVAFGKLMAMEGVPTAIADAVLGVSQNKYVVLLLINLLLLGVGMIMDAAPATIILGPLLLGIVQPLGVDPIHFGVIMIMNLSIGMVTPPVGVNLFVGTKISKIPMENTFGYTLKLLAGMIIVLMLVTYIPFFSMALPNLFV